MASRASASEFANVNSVLTPPRQLRKSQTPPRRLAFETQLKGDCEDVAQVWYDYTSWACEHCNRNETSQLLRRACHTLTPLKQYHDDPRLIQMWVKLAGTLNDRGEQSDLFEYVEAQGLGLQRTLLYEAWASVLEKQHAFIKAEEIYQRGIDRGARPLARLQKRFVHFRERMKQRAAREVTRASGTPPVTCGARAVALSGKDHPWDVADVRGDISSRGPSAMIFDLSVENTPSNLRPSPSVSLADETVQSGACGRIAHGASSKMALELTTHCLQAGRREVAAPEKRATAQAASPTKEGTNGIDTSSLSSDPTSTTRRHQFMPSPAESSGRDADLPPGLQRRVRVSGAQPPSSLVSPPRKRPRPQDPDHDQCGNAVLPAGWASAVGCMPYALQVEQTAKRRKI